MSNKQFINQNEKQYLIVDAISYVESLKSRGAEIIDARKSAYVFARLALAGEKIPVYIDTGKLEAEEIGIDGKVILTLAGQEGTPILDVHGHTNTWQTELSTYRRKYISLDPNDFGLSEPVGGIQKFIKVKEDIAIMQPWDPNDSLIPQVLDAGGYLNITDSNGIYAIAASEFDKTYTRV